MSQSCPSSAHGATRREVPAAKPPVAQSGLPLMRCPVCKKCAVIELVCNNNGPNHERRFFKCPRNIAKGIGCTFFAFEDEYVKILEEEELGGDDPDAADEHRHVLDSVKKEMVEMKNWGKVVVVMVALNLVMCVALCFLVK